MFEFVITFGHCVSILKDLAVVSCIGFCAYKYFKTQKYFMKYKLNIMDPLLDSLLSKDITTESAEVEDEVEVPNTESEVATKKERIISLIVCGKGVEYLGSNVSVEKVEKMTEVEINNLYIKYEKRLGSFMAQSLGKYALESFTMLAINFLPIPVQNRGNLLCDLEKDPFIGYALNSTCCNHFHKYGMLLAPITGFLTTLKHCQFEQKSSHCCPLTTSEPTAGTPEPTKLE